MKVFIFQLFVVHSLWVKAAIQHATLPTSQASDQRGIGAELEAVSPMEDIGTAEVLACAKRRRPNGRPANIRRPIGTGYAMT